MSPIKRSSNPIIFQGQAPHETLLGWVRQVFFLPGNLPEFGFSQYKDPYEPTRNLFAKIQGKTFQQYDLFQHLFVNSAGLWADFLLSACEIDD